MRALIVVVLCVAFFSVPVFGADETTQKTLPNDVLTQTWESVVSGNTVAMQASLQEIHTDTSPQEMNVLLRKALAEVQKMRDSAKKHGVIVESFSVNIAVPPSITVNFKFTE